MNLSWLQTFIYIVEKKSLTRAARALHLTQPAVSKQLNSLERYYGVPLLYRTSRHLEVTEAGKIVYEHSKKIMETLTASLNDVKALDKTIQGNLLLGASTIPGEYILPAALQRFQELYPQVRARLEIGDSTEIGNLILDGGVEAGIIGADLKNPMLKQEVILQDELVVIAPPHHPLAGRKTITIKDFVQEQVVVREKGSGTRLVIENRLKEKGISPERLNIKLEMGSTEAVVNAVAAGLGISLVSHFAVKKRIQVGELVMLRIEDFPPQRDIFFVSRQNQMLSPPMKTFYAFLKDYFNTH